MLFRESHAVGVQSKQDSHLKLNQVNLSCPGLGLYLRDTAKVQDKSH